MLAQAAISPFVHLPIGLGFRCSRSPSISISTRSCWIRIRCSFSQVHSYGTVDFERRPALKWSSLYRRISMESPSVGSATILDKWEEEERRLTKWELCRVAKELRKFRRYQLAFQVYEWMAAQGDRFMFTTSDMAIQLDLISKVNGILHAEEYFSRLQDDFKDKRVYGALLNVYGQAKMTEKAEVLFETIKAKGFAADALPFNVMLTLYMNVGEHDKVNKTINEMKEKKVNFDIYSYNIWITSCAAMGNLEEMERVVKSMNADNNISANWTTYSTLATMYIKFGDLEKAESSLREVQIRVTGRDRLPYHYLLGLYSNLGKRDEVYRVWNWYKSTFPSITNIGYQSVLSSLIKLDDIKGAEEIYGEWLSNTSNYDPRVSHILMIWYSRQGSADQAKSVLDRLLEKGGKPKPTTWEILAEGYIKKEQVSEALSCLKKAATYEEVNKWRPRPSTVADILEVCKKQDKPEGVEFVMDVLRTKGCLEREEYKILAR